MPEHDHERPDEHRHQVERGALVGRNRQAEDGHQRQADRGRDQRAGQGPDGERVVGPEAPEPAEAVDRRDGVPDGQRVRDRLRREGQLEQRPAGGRRWPGPEQLVLHGGEGCVRADLGQDGRDHPPPVERLEDRCRSPRARRSWRRAPTRRRPRGRSRRRHGRPARRGAGPVHRTPPGRLRRGVPSPGGRRPPPLVLRRRSATCCIRARAHRGGAGAFGGAGPLGRGAIRARRR